MINSKMVGKTLYVGLNGELDEKSALFVRKSFDELIEKNDISKLVIEMSQLNFMDSTGIGVLLGRYKKLYNLGIPIIIANPTRSVDKILTLSGIYKIMPKVISEE